MSKNNRDKTISSYFKFVKRIITSSKEESNTKSKEVRSEWELKEIACDNIKEYKNEH